MIPNVYISTSHEVVEYVLFDFDNAFSSITCHPSPRSYISDLNDRPYMMRKASPGTDIN